MKQYTTTEQTAKLIELGLEKPCSIASVEPIYGMGGINVAKAYSIGELIEMLPQYLDHKASISDTPDDYYALTIRQNVVKYCDPYMDWIEIQCDCHKELIDNLYDMVVELKEEGTI